MTRLEIKKELSDMVINLKSMSDELEKVLNEMDDLSDEEFDKKISEIEDKYSKKGIEIFSTWDELF